MLCSAAVLPPKVPVSCPSFNAHRYKNVGATVILIHIISHHAPSSHCLYKPHSILPHNSKYQASIKQQTGPTPNTRTTIFPDFLSAMSGLVDRWTSEASKIKEKDQSHYHESSKRVQIQEKEKISTGLAVMQIHKLNLLYSEASVSMLVEWCSP